MIPLHSKALKDFSFEPENFSQRILQESNITLTGYWQHRLQSRFEDKDIGSWYLCLLQGKAVIADNEPLSVIRLLAIAERYLPKMKTEKANSFVQVLKQKLSQDGDRHLERLPDILRNCYSSNLFSPEEIRRALYLKILNDFDNILFDSAGEARFLSEPDWSAQIPIIGFDLRTLLYKARKRRLIWDSIKKVLPSSDSKLALNHEAIERAKLSFANRSYLYKLLSYGETPDAISKTLGQDTLEISMRLAQLISKDLLSVQSIQESVKSEIVIIDDSQLMLQMFQTLVSSWGYEVRSHADPSSALNVLLQSRPTAIFLDINMPEISGFDLLKQIRRQPSLKTIPLIMLTAERTLSNNWRAQWSGCSFLSKPLSPEEFPNFKLELRMILEAMIG
ncbi:MAG: PleD family two-component system response regulator [Elainellaceae cyanobacterium]